MDEEEHIHDENVIDLNRQRLYRVADRYNFLAGKRCGYQQGHRVFCTVVEQFAWKEMQFAVDQIKEKSGLELFSFVVFIPELERYAQLHAKRKYTPGHRVKAKFITLIDHTIFLDDGNY